MWHQWFLGYCWRFSLYSRIRPTRCRPWSDIQMKYFIPRWVVRDTRSMVRWGRGDFWGDVPATYKRITRDSHGRNTSAYNCRLKMYFVMGVLLMFLDSRGAHWWRSLQTSWPHSWLFSRNVCRTLRSTIAPGFHAGHTDHLEAIKKKVGC